MKTHKLDVSYFIVFVLLCIYLAFNQDTSTLSSTKTLRFDSGRKLNSYQQLKLADGQPVEDERSTASVSLHFFLGTFPYASIESVVVKETYRPNNAGKLIKTEKSVIIDSSAPKNILDYGADVIFTCMFYLFFVGVIFMAQLTFKPANSLLSPAIWIFDMALFVSIVEQWKRYGFEVAGISIWAAATAIGLLLAIIALARFILSAPRTPSLSEQTIPALQTPHI